MEIFDILVYTIPPPLYQTAQWVTYHLHTTLRVYNYLRNYPLILRHIQIKPAPSISEHISRKMELTLVTFPGTNDQGQNLGFRFMNECVDSRDSCAHLDTLIKHLSILDIFINTSFGITAPPEIIFIIPSFYKNMTLPLVSNIEVMYRDIDICF